MAASPTDAVQTAMEVARIDEIEEYGVQIWTAHAAEPGQGQWAELDSLLDETEQLRSRQFRMAVDRRAYVLAHALRRAALARALAFSPHDVVISHETSGKPVLAGARAEREVFFSLPRSRDVVVFALSMAAPIGIDVAAIDTTIVDFDLLGRFVALPQASRREADLGSDPTRQFLFYWTALEAFWKAAGTGLASGNPRIRCEKNRFGTFDILLEMSGARETCACVVPVNAPAGCMVTLACLRPSA